MSTPTITRRTFLNRSLTAGVALGLPGIRIAAGGSTRSLGPNDTVRIAVIGLGSTTAVGGVGGRGHQLIPRVREVPGTQIVALCDVDQSHLEREAKPFKDRGETVATYRDLRRVFDDKNIDAVIVALPNHWHALATVWACQAGKDVYVEKPFSYNIWEGHQMVAAARKYGRMVQVGTQNRQSPLLREAFGYLRSGQLGPMRYVHALVYRARDGIGTVEAPLAVPDTVDYDLWCGPAPKTALRRKQLHYEWHWFWATGNGEMGNNGIHVIDISRWAMGHDLPPPRALSIGGRFAFNDAGETANTQIAFFDYQPAPLLCEIRNVRSSPKSDAMGKFRNQNHGIVIDCEGGYFAGDASNGAVFDKQARKIKDFPDDGSAKGLETAHMANFVAAVRSRKSGDLMAEALQGHRSTTCCHMANVSHRLGQTATPESIREKLQAQPELSDTFERCREYLRENQVDLESTPAVLGPWVNFDPKQDRFTGSLAKPANALSQREYRRPFVVPKIG